MELKKEAAPRTITAIFVPLRRVRLLLPAAMVAELVNGHGQPLTPATANPRWLAGQIDWRGWRVPVIDYEALCSAQQKGDEDAPHGKQILILKNPGHGSRRPYLALITQGNPQVKVLGAGEIDDAPPPPEPPSCHIERHVSAAGDGALIPSLAEINRTLDGLETAA